VICSKDLYGGRRPFDWQKVFGMGKGKQAAAGIGQRTTFFFPQTATKQFFIHFAIAKHFG
jgi:hypothetical protein